MTAINIALTVEFHYEPKMRKIIFHKNLSDFYPFRRYPKNSLSFINKLYIYHIILNRRDVKAYGNQCFVKSLVWHRYVNFRALAHRLQEKTVGFKY